ncbi:hypothetical protein [Nocardia abscessus]|uniref:hypothetical protein n=1 Tax=Nocardia abscessus TaxID=120957 RepID=UPI002458FAA4|nr:hypothetical protein [Nocardia abscessus]
MDADEAAPASLRMLGTVMDVYKRVFVSGPAAALLSRSNPVRRTGFELNLVVDRVEDEAMDVLSFTLRAADGEALPEWGGRGGRGVVRPGGKEAGVWVLGGARFFAAKRANIARQGRAGVAPLFYLGGRFAARHDQRTGQ